MPSYQDVDGYPLAYEEAGDGPPVLLIHGSLADYRAWSQQLPALSGDFRTIAVSLRHCYPERWNGAGDDFTVARHASDLARFIAGRGLGAVHVVGHSRGGAVAIELALRHRVVLRSLVLADPGGMEALLPRTPDGDRMAAESAAMFARLREDLARGDVERAARSFAESLGGPGAWERRSEQQKAMLLDNLATGPGCAERPRFTRDELASLGAPMLLVTGARSPRRYALMLGEMMSVNRNVAQRVTIPDAAHAMNRENPGAFNRELRAFFAAVS